MKLSVFMDDYHPFNETKDPGQIPLGLKEIEVETELVTLFKKDLADYHPNFPVIQVTNDDLKRDNFWSKNNSDVILAYTWLSEFYNPLIQKIKSAEKKVLIKADSDGRIGYPFRPSHLNVPLSEELTLEHVVEHVWWGLPFKFLHRRAGKIAKERIRQIELCDGVIIESPDALTNLNYFLSMWGRQDLSKKTFFVPNPVTPDFLNAEIKQKENLVVAYGRWNDTKQKNTFAMVKALVEFLEKTPNYTAIIFGGGKETIQNLTKDVSKSVADRLQLLGFVERERITQILSSAKMLFMPSRWESFGIVAGESVCMGCSVVGTPIESLRYLTMQGFSGTISKTFRKDELLAALLQDAAKWERNFYEPDKISKFWRTQLDRKVVAKNIAEIAQNSRLVNPQVMIK